MDENAQAPFIEDLELAAAKIRCAVEDRDEAITQALVAGVPAAVVARAVGLTRQRVWQIGRAAGDIRLSENEATETFADGPLCEGHFRAVTDDLCEGLSVDV